MESGKKKKVKASVAAAVTAAGVAVAGLVDSPGAILSGNAGDEHTESGENVEYFAEVTPGISEDIEDISEDEEDDDEEKKRKKGIKARARAALLSMPFGIRLTVLLPLWLLGSLILAFGGALTNLLSPYAGHIVSFLVTAVAVVGVFLLGAKAIFPDLPIKKILNRKTLPWLLFGALLITALDRLLVSISETYRSLRNIFASLGYFAVLAAVFIPWAKKEKKKRTRKAEIQEEESLPAHEEPEPLIVRIGDEEYRILTEKKEG